MKKKLVLILTAGLFAVSVTACGDGKSPGAEMPRQNSPENNPENDDITSTQITNDGEKTGDEKTITSVDEIEKQYKFVLDGHEYQLMYNRLSDFFSNGWTYSDLYGEVPEGTELETFTYQDLDIQKEDATVSVRLINLEEDNRPLEDCEVASITIAEGMPLFFQTGEGISLGDTLSDAKTAYGEYEYGFSEDDTNLSYNFYRSYEHFVSNDLVADFHIDNIDEQSLAEDNLRFQSPDGSDVINYIFMEYYSNA